MTCEADFNQGINEINIFRLSSKPTGTVRIGLVSGWSLQRFHLPYFLEFRQLFPGIRIEIGCHSPEKLMQLLMEQSLDLIITAETDISRRNVFNSSYFGTYNQYFIVSASHPFALGEMLPDRFSRMHFYMEQSSVQGKEEMSETFCSMHPVIARENIRFLPNMDTIIAAVEAESGFCPVLECSRFLLLPGIRSYHTGYSETLVMTTLNTNPSSQAAAFISLVTKMNAASQGNLC